MPNHENQSPPELHGFQSQKFDELFNSQRTAESSFKSINYLEFDPRDFQKADREDNNSYAMRNWDFEKLLDAVSKHVKVSFMSGFEVGRLNNNAELHWIKIY